MGVEEKPVSELDQFLTTGPVSAVLTNSLDKLGTHPAVHGQAEAGQCGPLQSGQVLPTGSPGEVVQNVSRAGNLWTLARLNCDWPLH